MQRGKLKVGLETEGPLSSDLDVDLRTRGEKNRKPLGKTAADLNFFSQVGKAGLEDRGMLLKEHKRELTKA